MIRSTGPFYSLESRSSTRAMSVDGSTKRTCRGRVAMSAFGGIAGLATGAHETKTRSGTPSWWPKRDPFSGLPKVQLGRARNWGQGVARLGTSNNCWVRPSRRARLSFLAGLGRPRLSSSGSCCPPPTGLRSTSLAYAEKVRPQFLSLRQLITKYLN
jgi:hypothetical protein